MDSGFPLTNSKQSLQKACSIHYRFSGDSGSGLFREATGCGLLPAKSSGPADLLDLLLNDKEVDRLYSAMAQPGSANQASLMQITRAAKLLPFTPRPSIFMEAGSVHPPALRILSRGRGCGAELGRCLVGPVPAIAGRICSSSVAKDRGWLAAYFDALSRVSPEQQAHLCRATD